MKTALFDENDPAWAIAPFSLHLPVLSAERDENGTISTPKPIVYGTAFPIAPGLLLTAAHVAEAAKADGAVAVSIMSGAGKKLLHYPVGDFEVVRGVDLALLPCPSLSDLPCLPLDFDHTLGMLAPASAVGFPLALDAEYVVCVARGFGGHVVTRRELYQLPAQPPGYEVSFFAPQGLSGAPLISTVYGAPRCYGYMIQQSTIGLGTERTPVGIAVSIEVLLSVKSEIYNRPLAELLGRKYVEPKAPSPIQLPGGMVVPQLDPNDEWPD